MKSIVLLVGSVAACWGQCTVTITNPATGSTVTGLTAIASNVSGCSNVNRVEYRINGQRMTGENTWSQSWSPASVPYFELDYNFSYLGDGTHVVSGQVIDSTGCTGPNKPVGCGNVLASTVHGVSDATVKVNDRNIGGITITSPSYGATVSGTSVPLNLSINVTPAGNPDLSGTGFITGVNINCFLNGTQIVGGTGGLSATFNLSFDSTKFENGPADLLCHVIGNPSGVRQWAVSEIPVTISNGSSHRELTTGYKTLWFWTSGTMSQIITPHFLNADNTLSATTASFVSSDPSVVTVPGCGSPVNSCTAIGQAGGAGNVATITATSGSYTASIRVAVQSGTPISPHQAADGTILTAYSATPPASDLGSSLFDGGTWMQLDNNSPAAILATHQHDLELEAYFSVYKVNNGAIPTLNQWQTLQNAVDGNVINSYISKGFHSVVGNCGNMFVNGNGDTLGYAMQSAADPSMTSRLNYLGTSLGGKLRNCYLGDEIALLYAYPPGGGVIGAANGPTQITVSGGNSVTVTWPALAPGWQYGADVTGASNSCFNTNSGFNTSGASGSFTYTASCSLPNGVYTTTSNPGGGAMNETGFTVRFYNQGCAASGFASCANASPWNLSVPNNVITNVVNTLRNQAKPIYLSWPLAGGATASNYKRVNGIYSGQRVSDLGHMYWAHANSRSIEAFTSSTNAISDISNIEDQFWNQFWPGVEQSKPWISEALVVSYWYSNGGRRYSISGSSGNTINLSAHAINARVGGKVLVANSSCNGNYTITGVVGIAWNPANPVVQGDVTGLVVSPTPPSCGTGVVYISSATGYFNPPEDFLKNTTSAPATRSLDVAIEVWTMLQLGSSDLRLYNTDQEPGTHGRANSFPTTVTTQWTNYGTGDGGQTGWWYTAPYSDRVTGLTQALGLAETVAPFLFQPLCSAPYLGSHIHVGAKCGSSGNMVIAISDIEAPNTLTFPDTLWAAYNPGGGMVTRYRIADGVQTLSATLPGNGGDSVRLDGPEVVVYEFPTGGGGTQTAQTPGNASGSSVVSGPGLH